jgi:hypothetical protein
MVMRAPYLLYLLAAASVAAAGLLVACGSPDAQTTSPGAPIASPAPTTGLVPAPRGLTDRLVLRQTHVTAGTPIIGTVVVTYRGRAPINLTHRCQPQYAVVVTNDRFPPAAAFSNVCSLEPFIIKPGENRLAVTVYTTYPQCSQVASQATRSSPACLDGGEGGMPSLPPGRYEAVLVGDGQLSLPAPAPVPVILTSAS